MIPPFLAVPDDTCPKEETWIHNKPITWSPKWPARVRKAGEAPSARGSAPLGGWAADGLPRKAGGLRVLDWTHQWECSMAQWPLPDPRRATQPSFSKCDSSFLSPRPTSSTTLSDPLPSGQDMGHGPLRGPPPAQLLFISAFPFLPVHLVLLPCSFFPSTPFFLLFKESNKWNKQTEIQETRCWRETNLAWKDS